MTLFRKRAVFLSYGLVGLVALVLRVADLGQFVTHDEVEFWFGRSEALLRALHSGNFQAMEISTHPGVTTMWLGSAGITLRKFLFEQGILQHETFPTILALYRLPIALAHVAGVLLGYGCCGGSSPPRAPCWRRCSGPPTPLSSAIAACST
ncbi:MAG: hypothetical protein HC884_15910 [Chloroflexaceae bacterium]|nr:hypothetical protein [Chloroflexaceae bacterium]